MTGPEVFVLGTGRCGSTLLSRMVRRHPDLVSISELFSFATDLGGRIERAFPAGMVPAEEFLSILSEPQPRQSLLLANELQMGEVIYPIGSGRFAADQIPPALQAMVPHLAQDEPDALFDELCRTIEHDEPRPISEHYRRLFDCLAERDGKSGWVERSGGGLRLAERIIEHFPEAKIIHLVRDGHETAISMSRHIGFRMAITCGLLTESLGVDPFETDDRSCEEDLTDELASMLPENFSRENFDRFDIAPTLCGHYWAGEIEAGLRALKALPEGHVLTVSYEQLVDHPLSTLTEIDQFVTGETHTDWIDDAASLVGERPERLHKLSPHERASLIAACEPGFEALASLDQTT